jgi:protein O-GlcNAc transferase
MNADGLIRGLFAKALDRLDRGDWASAETLLIEILRAKPSSIPTLCNLAIAQYEQNKITEAARTSRNAIDIDPKNIDALSMLSTCQQKQSMYRECLITCEQIISVNPTSPDAYVNCAYILNRLQQFDQALIRLDQAISVDPHLFIPFANRGNVLRNLKRYEEALDSYDKALKLKPDFADSWFGRGNVLTELKRFDEALVAYRKALEHKPDLFEAWAGQGNVLAELKRYDETLFSYHKALELNPDFADAWVGRGNVLTELKRYDDAFAAYDKALSVKPDLAEAWLGRGNVNSELRRDDEAFASYDKALLHKPDLAEAWLGRGNIFTALKRYDEAVAAYGKAISLKPDLPGAWLGRGNVFTELRRYDEGFSAYDKAFSLKSDLAGAEGMRLHTKMHICNWDDFDGEREHLIGAVKNGKDSTPPWAFLGVAPCAQDQLKCAKVWSSTRYPKSAKPLWQGSVYKHDKIRIAYISADFCQHPVSYLTVGVFECHDRSRFEVTAISFGPDDRSEMRKRLVGAFDHFSDTHNLGDDDIACRIKAAEIDILVDLGGFTQGSRTGVLARRPSPVQINYLGYPGTMGSDYVDYIITDRFVIPELNRGDYIEKVVYLPNTFQANDSQRKASERIASRDEVGLPQSAFVFCCFNNNYKITPHCFDIWMRLLKQITGSVLWVLGENESAKRNLTKEAENRGVHADGFIFAPRIPHPDYLTRFGLADLFLDTFPFNAGTTASDALWSGLPLITCSGDAFASRMAGSLLTAVGMPELITTSKAEYEELALKLASNPDLMMRTKMKLADNRLRYPIFDTRRFTRNLEAAYESIYRRYQAGLAPEDIEVPDEGQMSAY